MVVILPTSPGLIIPGMPYVKGFPPEPKRKAQDQKPYTTFQVFHDVEGKIELVHFTGPTVRQYPFLEIANQILTRLEVTTIFENPDDVLDDDYEFLKTQKSLFEKMLAREVGMQPAAYKKAKEALRLVNAEIERLTPEPIQRLRKK